MGLEIQVSTLANGSKSETTDRGSGDIIAIKLEGSPWGQAEKKTTAIIRITNSVWALMPNSAVKRTLFRIWQKLNAQKAAGELYPVIVTPTQHLQNKTESSESKTITRRFVKRLSRRYLDLNEVPERIRRRWMDPEDAVDPVEPTLAQLSAAFKVKPNPTPDNGCELKLSDDDE